jgi:hypothetical protein
MEFDVLKLTPLLWNCMWVNKKFWELQAWERKE